MSHLLEQSIPKLYLNWSINDLVGPDNMEEIKQKVSQYLNDPNLELNGNNLYVYSVENGTGKCITGDSLVLTKKGLVSLESLHPNTGSEGYHPSELDILSKDGFAKTSHFYDSGVRSTLKIKTKQGFELEGTYKHPLLVLNEKLDFEFRRLDQLAIGDMVCIQRGQDCWNEKGVDLTGFKFKKNDRDYSHNTYQLPTTLTPEFARFLGYLVAEGCMGDSTHVEFTNTDIEVLRDYTYCCQQVFGISPKTTISRGVVSLVINSVYIKQFLNYCGVDNVLSNKKEIPWVILQSPKEIATEYLRAYFEGDGYCSKTSEISVATASEKMAKQLQILLLNFNIISSKKSMWKAATNGKNIKRLYWKIVITDKVNLEAFKQIGFLSQRKQERIKVVEKANTNVDVIPFVKEYLNDHIAPFKGKFGKGNSTGMRAKGNEVYGKEGWLLIRQIITSPAKKFTYRRLNQLEKYGLLDEKIKQIMKYNFFFSPIQEITKNEAHTYDLTIPEGHNFFSNGFISHNTSLAYYILGQIHAPRMKDNHIDITPIVAVKFANYLKFCNDYSQDCKLAKKCVELAPFLLLDDVSPWANSSNLQIDKREFVLLMMYRREHLLPTIITSNLVPEAFEKMYGATVTSKVLENFSYIQIQGADIRAAIYPDQFNEVE